MRRSTSMLRGSLLVAALIAVPGAASAIDSARTFVVQQPAIGVPLALERAGKLLRARIDVPSIVETIEIAPGRAVRILANEEIPATLELGNDSHEITVRLERAAFIAEESGRAHFERTLRAFDASGDQLAAITIRGELDLFGLGFDRPLVSMLEAIVRKLEGTRGVLSGMKLAGDSAIATRAFPLELLAPDSSLSLKVEGESLAGQVVLEKHLSPGAFRGERATRLGIQLFDADGVVREKRAVSFEVTEGDRWASADGATTIDWSKVEGRWQGNLRLSAADPLAGALARATMTLGDPTSIIVVQTSGVVTRARSQEHAAR